MYREIPVLSVVLSIIGVLQIIGGIVISVKLWPGDAGRGYQWPFSAYTPALTWISVGIVSAVLFFAAAAGIAYLAQIRSQTEGVDAKLCRIERHLNIDETMSPHKPTSTSVPSQEIDARNAYLERLRSLEKQLKATNWGDHIKHDGIG